MSDMLSFEEAMAELGLGRDELENLTASGELRGTHDDGEIRFKAEDVAALKASRESDPTMVLSDFDIGDESPIDLDSISTDETVLNIEGLLEDEAEGTTPVPGMGILEDEDEFNLDAIGEDTVLDTDGLDLDDDFDLGSDDDTVAAGTDDTFLAAGGTQQMQVVRKKGSPAMVGLLVATMVIMLAPAAVLLNLMAGPNGVYPEWVSDSPLAMLNSLVES
ncbi:MAG: helix-turn-helix domain-containing protein, partial [Planctomycetota bacterium]